MKRNEIATYLILLIALGIYIKWDPVHTIESNVTPTAAALIVPTAPPTSTPSPTLPPPSTATALPLALTVDAQLIVSASYTLSACNSLYITAMLRNQGRITNYGSLTNLDDSDHVLRFVDLQLSLTTVSSSYVTQLETLRYDIQDVSDKWRSGAILAGDVMLDSDLLCSSARELINDIFNSAQEEGFTTTQIDSVLMESQSVLLLESK